MGYRKSSRGAGAPNEKVYMLHHYNKHSSKPCCLWCVVSEELTAQLNLWTALKRKLQWTFLIEVFLLKCQYYRRPAPRGSGKLYKETRCSTGFLSSHLLIQQSVYIMCGTGSTQLCHSRVILHLFTKETWWRLLLAERSTEEAEEVRENIGTTDISAKQALVFFCSSLTNDMHLFLSSRLMTNLDKKTVLD